MPKNKGEKKIEIPRGIPKDWASRLEAFYKVSSKDKSVSSAPLGSDCGGEQPTFEEEVASIITGCFNDIQTAVNSVARMSEKPILSGDDVVKEKAKSISKLALETALKVLNHTASKNYDQWEVKNRAKANLKRAFGKEEKR